MNFPQKIETDRIFVYWNLVFYAFGYSYKSKDKLLSKLTYSAYL